jgi:YHS domain-containing protein
MRNVWIMSMLAIALGVASCSQKATSPNGETAAVAPTTETAAPTEVAASPEPEVAAPANSGSLAAVNSQDGIAIEGADPVAYFTEGAYVPGSEQFTHDWSGVTWYFASAANRDTFVSNPEQYAPQYGGFCAWAVSQGYTAPIDPQAWKIVDGKLYLNYDRNVQAKWEKDVPGNIAKADANWPQVAAE